MNKYKKALQGHVSEMYDSIADKFRPDRVGVIAVEHGMEIILHFEGRHYRIFFHSEEIRLLTDNEMNKLLWKRAREIVPDELILC